MAALDDRPLPEPGTPPCGSHSEFCLAVALSVATIATAADPKPKPVEVPLTLANREVAVFRPRLLGTPPALRVERARARFDQLEHAELADPVKAVPAALADLKGISLMVGDRLVFSLLEGDLDPEEGLTLAQAAERARAHLEDALRAKRELQAMPVLCADSPMRRARRCC